MADLKAPYIWFGGKSKVAHEVWARLGDVRNYVEPFFGSGAVLLNRPDGWTGIETVNDADGFISNFWRAMQHAPEEVAQHADHPVNENDLHARHVWLVGQREAMTAKLEGDPLWYDARIAGWWCWGLNCWIGSGWCSGKGPWQSVDGELVNVGTSGRGVNRKRPHLGNNGTGVNRQLPHLAAAGRGSSTPTARLQPWFSALSERLRGVRVACGDWSRVCGPSVTFKHGLTGVFLDPPYADTAKRRVDLYAIDCLRVAHDVREWAIKHGDNPEMRIALCGYDGEHAMPDGWDVLEWDAGAGYSGQGNNSGDNGKRERIWFSPHCRKPNQLELF